MTIQNLINKVQEEKPNTFTDEKLLSFLTEVEADVAEELKADKPVYTISDMAVEMLAPSPYDRLYVSYVKAMIDYSNEEYDSYANNQAQHIQDFRDFSDWVVRTGQAESSDIPRRFVHAMY